MKPTSEEIAHFINKKLLERRDYVSVDDIVKDYIQSNENAKVYLDSIIPSYKKRGFLETETTAIFKEDCKDVIKHAKQRINKALSVYGFAFDVNKREFRYPDNLTFDPMADGAARQVKIDKSEVVLKYQKSLLKCLDNAIAGKKAVTFDYSPSYDAEIHKVVFHPHCKREYNGRIFVFGDETVTSLSGVDTKYCGHSKQGNIAIDRIFSDEIKVLDDVDYIEPSVDYSTFFDDIVGVSHMNGAVQQSIVIKTHNPYIHGLLLTKPIHKTQEETKEFDGTSGEFTINVCYNKELLGALFHFEGNIEVVSPAEIRKMMADEAKRMYELYK